MSIIFQDGLIPIPLILGERKRIEKRPSNVDSSILISGRRMLILWFWFLGQEMFIASSTVRWTTTIAEARKNNIRKEATSFLVSPLN